MYIFRTLVLVGIISLSTCRPEIESQIQPQEQQETKPNVLLGCPDLPSKQQLSITANFRDVRYVISTFNPQIPSNKSEDKTICVKFTSQVLENGYVREFHTQLSDPMIELHLEMIINLNEFQNGVSKFIGQARSVYKDGTKQPFYPVRTTIIDTDYTNYVEHKCLPAVMDLLCIYLILNRKPYVLDSNVEPILNKHQLKLQDFTLMNKPGCAEA